MKKVKRTLTIAILAAVLSANLASCVVSRDPTDTGEVYTGENGSSSVTLPIDPSDKPEEITFEPISKTVYVSIKSKITKVGSDETVTLEPPTKLVCTGQSTNWYKVTYEGAEYYISRARTTDDDIEEKTFTSASKTMYVNTDYLNIRKYPSAEDFSTILASKERNDELKVVAESSAKGWSKVEFTKDGKTATGFVKSTYLSSSKGGSDADYIQYFTKITETTMYVNVDRVNLRATPYKGENGGKIVAELTKGNAVQVVAEGTVDGYAWYAVKYEEVEGAGATQCFISKDCVQRTVPGEKATLEQLLEQYPELKRFDNNEIKTLYTTGSVWARSAPSCEKDSKGNSITGLETLDKKTEVRAVAYGKIKGIDPEGKDAEMTWCLAQNDKWGYYFVSFGMLTPNADGTPGTIPLSLEQMIQSYGFTAVDANMVVKAGKSAPGKNTPDGEVVKTFTEGQNLKVVAKGSVDVGLVSNDWYIVEFENSYYFVLQSLLEIA